MEITVQHKGKPVVLTATAEQEAALKASEKDIMQDIDTWEDILAKTQLDDDEKHLLAYAGTNPRMMATKGELMLKIMCDVMNEGWIWQPGQKGWLPWFNLEGGGFAFSDSRYDYWYSDSHVGSRRCLKTEQLSDFCTRKFPEVFKLIILNK